MAALSNLHGRGVLDAVTGSRDNLMLELRGKQEAASPLYQEGNHNNYEYQNGRFIEYNSVMILSNKKLSLHSYFLLQFVGMGIWNNILYF